MSCAARFGAFAAITFYMCACGSRADLDDETSGQHEASADATTSVAETDGGSESGVGTAETTTSSEGSGGTTGGDQGDSDWVFEQTSLRSYRLTVDTVDWQWLNDNAELEQYVPATLEVDGENIGPIGIRYKGGVGTLQTCFDNSGNRICDKLSIKLSFHEYQPGLRFHGLKKLNFHSMIHDDSHLHDRLGYSLFAEMNVAAPRAVHARVVVNDELLGLFALVEQIDGRFTRERFADGGTGNVYKEVWPRFFEEQPYLNALETNEDEMPSVANMVAFAEALRAATDQNIESVLNEWMDLDHMTRYLAVDRTIESWDGIVAWYCPSGGCFNHNYYWYESASERRMWLIPWDLDNSFASPNFIESQYGMPNWNDVSFDCTQRVQVFWGLRARPAACDEVLIRRFATVIWDRYVLAVENFLDGPFQVSALEAKVDTWAAQIAPAVEEDPNGPGMEAWQAAVEQLRGDFTALRQTILDEIAG